MEAMVINRIGSLTDDAGPLEAVDLPESEPGEGEIRIRVSASADGSRRGGSWLHPERR